MKKKKGFNQRKYILEIKEFKKKKNIHEIINKIHEKQKALHKEYNTIFDLRIDKLRHNALTNNHLQHYIADLNFRLYSLPEKDKSFEGEEIKLIKHYSEIISLLEKFQNMKGEKFLSDKKELEDRIMEQSLEEQIKELSCLGRQEKYEKYIYDKLILAQNGLIDICQKYRTQVHDCEKYELLSLKLKSEYAICLDTHKKLNETLLKQKEVEQKLKNKLNKLGTTLSPEKFKTFKPILSGTNNNSNSKSNDEKILSIENNKEKNLSEEKYHKINIRPKSSIRLNKNNSALIIDKNNTSINNNKIIYNKNKGNKNYYNNYLRKDSSTGYLSSNIVNLETNKKLNFGRTYARKITFRQKSSLNKNTSINTTNYLSKDKIIKNKSMSNIKRVEDKKFDDNVYDRKYLDIVIQYLTDNINKAREEIKLKTKFIAEEVRSTYQLKYMLTKCIEDTEIELDTEKKDKNICNRNYYENILGIAENKEKKEKENQKFDQNIELFQNRLYILTYIFDNSFNGLNNINSIFPEFRSK